MIKGKWYAKQNICGFDPWKFTYRGIVGGRGIGKTVDIQKLVVDKALYNKESFAWVRTNKQAVANCVRQFPDAVVRDYVKSKIEAKNGYFKVNGKVRGHFLALSQAHNIKGSSFDWKSITNIVFDEFNMEPTEKKAFDLVDAFLSIVETIARPEIRQELHEQGYDIKPCTIWFLGNDTQEASPLLEQFGFVPTKHGRYVLPNKFLVLEYVEDSEEWKAKRKKSPLHVLRKKDDMQIGQGTREAKITVKRMGDLDTPRHKYRIYTGLNESVDVFYHKEGVWMTRQFDSKTILRMHGYSSYVINPVHLRAGRVYNKEIVKRLQAWLWTDTVSFDSPITGRLVIGALSRKS